MGNHLTGLHLFHVPFDIMHPAVIEYHDERRAVWRQRLLDAVHFLARNADRIARQITNHTAGSRAEADANWITHESDDGADDRTHARVRLALIEDLDLALWILRDNGDRRTRRKARSRIGLGRVQAPAPSSPSASLVPKLSSWAGMAWR